MKVIFYCSYDFSAYGFEFVSVDFEKGETGRVTRKNGIPDEIYAYFSRAGVSTLCGMTEEKQGFFLLKGLKHFDTSRKEGEQGYTQHYNLVFMADEHHSDKDILKLAAFALGNYQLFVSEIASVFLVKPEIQEGYTVYVDKLRNFINRTLKENPVNNPFAGLIEPTKNKFKVAVLDENWAYALKMYDMPDNMPKPDITYSSEQFKEIVEGQNKVATEPMQNAVTVSGSTSPDEQCHATDLQLLVGSYKSDIQTLKKSFESQEKMIQSVKTQVDDVNQTLKRFAKPLLIGLIAGFSIGLVIGLLI